MQGKRSRNERTLPADKVDHSTLTNFWEGISNLLTEKEEDLKGIDLGEKKRKKNLWKGHQTG